MNPRQQKLEQWVKEKCGLAFTTWEKLAGDASFRSYSRIQHQGNSYVVMDAPPPRETTVPFITIANALRTMGLHTPNIIASDVENGFLLLSDLGDRLLIHEKDNPADYYKQAIQTLSVLQRCNTVSVPLFSESFMREEMEWFKDWFLRQLLHLPEAICNQLNHFFDWLAKVNAAQSYCFMHRDYHSQNLMILPHQQIGILDFQDAFQGPVTYDLVSLLRDCYVELKEEVVNSCVNHYFDCLTENKVLSHVSLDQFHCWFDWMGMQRHLKAILTYARKHIRDQQSQYLKHIPLAFHYLLSVSARYAESEPLRALLVDTIIPTFEKEKPCAP